MKTTHQARHPQGRPTGGQFASRENPEPDLDLDLESLPQIVVSAKQYSSVLAWRYGVDADDLTQEALLAYVSAVHKGTPIANPGGYVKVAAARRAATAVFLSQPMSRDDGSSRAAVVILRDRSAERMQALGRELTRSEVDELAESIRESFPARRRPKKGFHHPRSIVSLDAVGEPAVASDPDSFDMDHGDKGDFGEGSAGALAEDLIQQGGGSKVAARRLAWRALAEKAEAPLAASGTLNWRHSSRARETVTQAGGVVAVAQDWERGNTTSAASSALFAPFGSIDDAGKAQVCALLLDHPSFAEDLWFVAMSEASTRAAG